MKEDFEALDVKVSKPVIKEVASKVFVPFLNRRFNKKCDCCNIWRKNYLLGLEELNKRKEQKVISVRQHNKDGSSYFVDSKEEQVILFSDIIEIFGSGK